MLRDFESDLESDDAVSSILVDACLSLRLRNRSSNSRNAMSYSAHATVAASTILGAARPGAGPRDGLYALRPLRVYTYIRVYTAYSAKTAYSYAVYTLYASTAFYGVEGLWAQSPRRSKACSGTKYSRQGGYY